MSHSISPYRPEPYCTDYRGVKLVPAIFILAITSIALLILGGTGHFGPLPGVGAISGFTLAGLNLATLLFIGYVAYIRKSANKLQITTQCTPEQINLVKWYCPSDSSRDRLAPYGTTNLNNGLLGDKWEGYEFEAKEKLVIVITIATHQAAQVYGEEFSPSYNIVKKFYKPMNKRLFVLFDLENVGPEIKQHWAPGKDHRNNISPNKVWDPIFKKNQWVSTVDPQWMAKLDSFIAS